MIKSYSVVLKLSAVCLLLSPMSIHGIGDFLNSNDEMMFGDRKEYQRASYH